MKSQSRFCKLCQWAFFLVPLLSFQTSIVATSEDNVDRSCSRGVYYWTCPSHVSLDLLQCSLGTSWPRWPQPISSSLTTWPDTTRQSGLLLPLLATSPLPALSRPAWIASILDDTEPIAVWWSHHFPLPAMVSRFDQFSFLLLDTPYEPLVSAPFEMVLWLRHVSYFFSFARDVVVVCAWRIGFWRNAVIMKLDLDVAVRCSQLTIWLLSSYLHNTSILDLELEPIFYSKNLSWTAAGTSQVIM